MENRLPKDLKSHEFLAELDLDKGIGFMLDTEVDLL